MDSVPSPFLLILVCAMVGPVVAMELSTPAPTPLSKLLEQCGTQGGFSVLCDPLVSQLTVRCRAKGLEPREALHLLAESYCLQVRRMGEVAGKETYGVCALPYIDRKDLRGICRTRLLAHVDPPRARAVLARRFAGRLALGVRGRCNSIVLISGSETLLGQAEELLSHLDQPRSVARAGGPPDGPLERF